MQTEAQRGVNELVGNPPDARRPAGFGRDFSCCALAVVRGNFVSVRDYGLRTYEPRQGRNAATVA